MDEFINKFVVVTTNKDRRGVFGGILVSHEGDKVVLRDAQNCVHWSVETRGVFGLAAIGPQPKSCVSPIMPLLEVDGITSKALATEEAIERWRSQPWS